MCWGGVEKCVGVWGVKCRKRFGKVCRGSPCLPHISFNLPYTPTHFPTPPSTLSHTPHLPLPTPHPNTLPYTSPHISLYLPPIPTPFSTPPPTLPHISLHLSHTLTHFPTPSTLHTHPIHYPTLQKKSC